MNELFCQNEPEIHNYNTRQRKDLHPLKKKQQQKHEFNMVRKQTLFKVQLDGAIYPITLKKYRRFVHLNAN